MSQIINLNKARKARDKIKKRVQADENAVKFGRTKDQKHHEQMQAEKAERDLDGHERDP